MLAPPDVEAALFYRDTPTGPVDGAFAALELIYHNTVRTVRKTHANALMALLMSILQTVIFVLAFYLLFVMLGMRGTAIRGDFMLYIMSGIFLYMVHTKTVQAVYKSEGPSAPMMKHAPMTTAIAIASAALGTLYLQVLSMGIVLFVYHVGFNAITIHDPAGAMGMVLMAWFSGIAVGMILLALNPWAPGVVSVIALVYTRANMLASGKMFVAN